MVTAGLLFDILGLTHIPFIMFNPLVAMPLSSLVISISIYVALRFPGIDSLSRWILSVLAWLLPPFSILSLVFVTCLPLEIVIILVWQDILETWQPYKDMLR